MGKINSRAKGANGERELAKFLAEHGFDARRGQQFSGGKDSPDVVSERFKALGIHIEAKRVEAGNPYVWMEQATRDAGDNLPVVMHRKNGKRWLAVLDLEDFLLLLHSVEFIMRRKKPNG